MPIDVRLKNLDAAFPADFTEEQRAKAKTLFLKTLSEEAHRFYGGKMQTVPRCGVYGFNWFNVWYTPGVSKVSTAIRCAHSIADFSEKRGIDPNNIVATMEETDVFAVEAADVAMQAIAEGVARVAMSWEEVYAKAKADIEASRKLAADLMASGHIAEPPAEMLEKALAAAVAAVR